MSTYGEGGIEEQHPLVGPAGEVATGEGNLGAEVAVYLFDDIDQRGRHSNARRDGEAQPVGLAGFVVGVLSQDDHLDFVERGMVESGEDVADAAVKPMGAPTPMAQAEKNGQKLVTSMTGGMESNKPSAVTTAGGIMTDMHTAMGAVSFTGIGGNVVSGILSGLNDKAPSLMSRAASLAGSIAETVRRTLNINSPSKIMIPMGQAVAEGMEVGLMQGAGSLYDLNP